jgi:hypothetical protein
MDTWLQIPLFAVSPPSPNLQTLAGDPIAPQQVWRLLTTSQQQIAIQALIQVSLELVQTTGQEAHDEPS